MSNSYHLHILTEQTEDDGPVQQNGLLLRCFSLQCRRQNSNCRSIFTTKTQTQMVWVTNLTWNAPKMIYHVLSTLSGPLCSHLHLWCLQSVFTRSASLRFFFFASYLSHLELISFFSDSHFAVKNLTNHWHVQNLSAQNFFLPHLYKLHCLPFFRSKHIHMDPLHTGRNHSSSSNPRDLLHATKTQKRANSLAEAEQLRRPRGA